MVVYLSLFVCFVGLVLYSISSSPKPMEIGRLMFGSGLFVFLLETGAKMFPFLK